MPKYKLELIDKYDTAKDTPVYRFAKPEGFEYLPGQHMVVQLGFETDDPDEQIRDMTLSSSPSEDFLEMAMRHSSSLFKQHLADLEIGTEVTMFGPTGTFVLPKDSTHPLVMIAGGIGITPFRSMIRFILDNKSKRRIILLYSNPTEESLAFKEELDEIQADSGNDIEIIFSLTKEAKIEWPGERGRIGPEMIKKYVDNLNNSIFMVCGPEKMVHYINSILLDLGIVQEKIIKEEFTGYEEKLD